MNKIHFLLCFQWVLYCVFHSLLANNKVKNFFYSCFKISSIGYRLGFNLLSIVWLMALIYYQARIISWEIFTPNLYTGILSVTLIVIGGIIMIVCIFKYFNQLSGLPIQKISVQLQTNGMHGWVRHPLYLGTILFLAGLFILWPLMKNLLVMGIIIIYTLAGAWLEEDKLITQFGDAYLKYKEKVPMILPRIKFRKN
jgi:methanethiol S-methyltransferase